MTKRDPAQVTEAHRRMAAELDFEDGNPRVQKWIIEGGPAPFSWLDRKAQTIANGYLDAYERAIADARAAFDAALPLAQRDAKAEGRREGIEKAAFAVRAADVWGGTEATVLRIRTRIRDLLEEE